MSDIDWKDVAVRIVQKVETCCGCNCYDGLTDEESQALEKAITETRTQQA